MAKANVSKVVNLKFGVDVTASKQAVKQGLDEVVQHINKSPIKVAFDIDTKAIKKQVDDLLKLTSQLKQVAADVKQVTSPSSANPISSVKTNSQNYAAAKAQLAEYSAFKKQYTREVVSHGKDVQHINALCEASQAKLKTAISLCTAEQQELLNIKKKQAEYDTLDKINQEQAFNKLRERIQGYIKLNEETLKRTEEGREQLRIAKELAQRTLNPKDTYANKQETLKDVSFKFQQLAASANLAETGLQKLERQFKNKFGTTIAATVIGAVSRALKQMFDNVKQINGALTQLSIVSGKSLASFDEYAKKAAQSASNLAVSITELIESTTVYARLGFSLEDATKYAELTTMYSRAGDVAVSEATANITAVIKAFNIEGDELELALDKMVRIGNKFAISSSEIGEAMNNAASSLVANNNTFDESLAILTAAQTTLQNISKSSTAVRTIAARISASSTDLDELGETDVLASADLDKRMRAYGIAITDANGELRSTFDVLKDIASQWDELNTVERAAIADMVAGTRQQAAFYSIIQNWEDTKNVITQCGEASGTLQEAQEKYLNSIPGQLSKMTALWQQMSQNILNSEFVKTSARMLNSLFDLINDGLENTELMIIYTLSAITAAIIMFHAKIAAFCAKNATQILKFGLVGAFTTLLVYLNTIDGEAGRVGMILTGVILAVVASFTIGCKLVETSFLKMGSTIQSVIASTPILNIIALIIAAVTALAMGISKFVKNRLEQNAKLAESDEEIRKNLSDKADGLRDISDAASDATLSIKELVDEFKELGDTVTYTQWSDTLNNIGNKINDILPTNEAQLSTIDAINKLLGTSFSYEQLITATDERRLSLLKDIQKASADVTAENAKNTYYAQREIYSNGNTADGRQTFKYKDDGTYGGTEKKYVKSQNKAIYDILYGIDNGISVDLLNLNKQLDVVISAKDAQDYLEKLKLAIGKLEANAGIFSDLQEQTVYKWLKSELDNAEAVVGSEITALQDYAKALTSSIGLKLDVDVNATGDKLAQEYESVIKQITTKLRNDATIKNGLDSGLINDKTLREFAIKFLQSNYTSLFENMATTISGVVVELKSFLSILNEIKDEYDAITGAMEDMNKIGFLSAETISSLMQDFPDLFNQFLSDGTIIKTQEGYYKLAEDAADKYLTATQSKYNQIIEVAKKDYEIALSNYNKSQTKANANALLEADKNYNNAIANAETAFAAINSLALSDRIDKYVDSLEAQKDALQDQYDIYQKTIDLRKELLSTYEEEIQYQRELNKKQTNVGNLQAMLSTAGLDTSAAGQARVRELQAQLSEAQEELNDFTLSHAIDDLQAQLDSEASENQSFLDEKFKEIENAIENAGTYIASITKSAVDAVPQRNSTVNIDAPSAERVAITGTTPPQLPSGSSVGGGGAFFDALRAREYPMYHSGGVVGDAYTDDNEEFAKLLKGEFVATPAQMRAFMNRTLPNIGSSMSSQGNTYNAPLVSITCESITQETLPAMKTAINQAVDSIKRELDSAMSRSGRNHTLKKVTI